MAESVVVELDVRVESVEKEIAKLKQSLEDTKKKTNELGDAQKENMSNLDKLTGGAVSGFRALKSGIQSAVIGMKTLRGAIAATGIGLLIVAFTSLMAYFKKTERGAQQLRVITAALGAVFDVIMDVVIGLGESIFNLFTKPKETIMDFHNTLKKFVIDAFTKVLDGIGLLGSAIKKVFEGDFSGALEDAGKGVVKLADGFTDLNPATAVVKQLAKGVGEVATNAYDAANAAADLETRLNNLKVAERDLKVDRAEANKEIERQKMLAEDVTKSFDDRTKAAQKAGNLERELLNRELSQERERLRIMEAKAAQAESDEETLNAIADQRAKIFDLEAGSTTKQIELQNKLNGLKKEAAQIEWDRLYAIKQAEQEELEGKIALQEKLAEIEKQKVNDVERALNEIDDIYIEIEAEEFLRNEEKLKREKDLNDKLTALRKSEAEKQLAIEQQKQAAIDGLANQGFQLIGQLAGQGSDLAKTMAVAQVTYETYNAVMSAFSSAAKNPLTSVFPAFPFIQAGLAGAFGAMQIKNLLADNGTGGASSGGSAASAMVTPSVNLTSAANQNNALGNIAQNTSSPMRAYVVSKDVETAAAYERSRKTIGTL